MTKDDYFVKLQNPKETRKLILENSREVLKILQGYEDFRTIRENKLNLIAAYKADINKIKSLIKALRKMLPKTNIKITKKAPKIKAEVQKEPRELRKLEQELADIESKLSNL